MMKARKIEKQIYWAYFAPDGHVQTRTIMPTKKLARECLPLGLNEKITYLNYEAEGFKLLKVEFSISVIN